jgi:hypothetical protein
MRSRTHMASLRLHMCHLEAPSRPCTQRSYARKSLSMPLPTPVACHTPASSFGRAKVRSWTPASVQNDVRRAPHPSVCPITPLPSVRFVCGSLESCQLSCCGRALCVPCCARPFLLPPHLPPSHVLPFPIPRPPPPLMRLTMSQHSSCSTHLGRRLVRLQLTQVSLLDEVYSQETRRQMSAREKGAATPDARSLLYARRDRHSLHRAGLEQNKGRERSTHPCAPLQRQRKRAPAQQPGRPVSRGCKKAERQSQAPRQRSHTAWRCAKRRKEAEKQHARDAASVRRERA